MNFQLVECMDPYCGTSDREPGENWLGVSWIFRKDQNDLWIVDNVGVELKFRYQQRNDIQVVYEGAIG
jgi:hypothetical protein